MRLFAAVFPPPEAKATIAAIQKRVHAEVKQKGTYPHPDKLHITLRFWGETLPQPTVKMFMHEVVQTLQPLKFRFEALDGFPPNARLKRVAFLAPSDPAPIAAVMRALGDSDPNPHLTLARYMQPAELPRFRFEPFEFVAEKIVLIDSLQFGAERNYAVVAEWKLG